MGFMPGDSFDPVDNSCPRITGGINPVPLHYSAPPLLGVGPEYLKPIRRGERLGPCISRHGQIDSHHKKQEKSGSPSDNFPDFNFVEGRNERY